MEKREIVASLVKISGQLDTDGYFEEADALIKVAEELVETDDTQDIK